MLADSNILVYAINSSSPKHLAAQDFLRRNSDKLAVAHQNIMETLRVLTHPKFASPMPVGAAISAVTAITDACRIIIPDDMTGPLALELIRKYQLSSDKIFDAYLAATALSAGITAIATDNTGDFEKFELLSVINPFSGGGDNS